MQTSVIGSAKWWQWPTILSLDAPLVALLWQWEIAHAAHAHLTETRAFVLGVSVWLAYAADRWFEGWTLHPDRVRTQRHLFYQRARWPVAAVWLVALVLDLTFALTGLDSRELEAGFVLLAAVLAYLLSHQVIHRHHPWRAPKEVCVALLLAGGAGLFLVTQPGVGFARAAVPLAVFACLCFANCALISVWEDAVDQSHGQTSLARQFSWGSAFGKASPWILAGVSAVWWVCASGQDREAATCAFFSAVLLAVVDGSRPRLGWELSRILADVALMTPLVPWIIGRGV